MIFLYLIPDISYAQYSDPFDNKIQIDQSGLNGWSCYTGDDDALIWFADGQASLAVNVDATHDKQGIWWVIIKRDITKYLDIEKAM